MSAERPAYESEHDASSPAGGEALLTLDLGNSSSKAVLWAWESDAADAGELSTWSVRPLARAAWTRSSEGQPDEALARVQRAVGAWLGGLAEELPRWRVARAALSTVADLERSDRWRTALTGLGLQAVQPDPGLELALRNPETCGLDRQFAARGAVEWVGGSCVVLDAGTALTVDAVRYEPGEPGTFLGGAIAPGPELLADALARGGARLWEVEPDPRAPALGQDTSAALNAGCSVGFRGAGRELARAVGLEAGLAGAPRIFTGGARRFLLEPDAVWSGAWREDEDLVHRGLWAACRGPLPELQPESA
ncbi:MAG: type III pantothenate kinase [Planctomycetota bacterium]